MAEELQGLLNRLHEKGVLEAEAEKENIVAEAKKSSEKILKDAHAEGENIIKKAREEAAKHEARAKSAIQQASRDIVLSLKDALQTRLEKVIKESISEAMTTQLMEKLLLEMAASYTRNNPDKEPGIKVLLNEKDVADMEKAFKASLKKDLKTQPEIIVSNDFGSGFKVGFKNEDVYFDFSDDSIADIFTAYLGPKFSSLFKE